MAIDCGVIEYKVKFEDKNHQIADWPNCQLLGIVNHLS